MEEYNKVIVSFKGKPQLSAFVLGFNSELTKPNPYKYKKNMPTWKISFYNAFERGRKIKQKYLLTNHQEKLF